MATTDSTEPVDVSSLQDHLSKALDCAESKPAKYHLREAYQKVVILEEGK
ncbi:hypothetical protein [Salinibaculum salinum]